MATVNSTPLPQVQIETRDTGRVDRPDAPRSEERQAETLLQERAASEIFTNQRITVDFVRRMREVLRSQTNLSEGQINRILTEQLASPESNPLPGSEDPAVLQEARGETQPDAAPPEGSGEARPDARRSEERGREARGGDGFTHDQPDGGHRQLVRGDRQPANPTPQTPRPQTPPPPAATPTPTPTPTPQATPTKGATGGRPGDTSGPQPEGTPRGEGEARPDQPPASTNPVAPRTGVPGEGAVVAEGTPAPEVGDVHVFNYGEKPRPGSPDPDRVSYGLKAEANFRMLTSTARAPTPAPMPTPQGGGEGGVRLADLLRRPGSSSSSREDRSLALGYGRGGAGALVHRGSSRDRYGGGTGGYC